jgi:hypothetical protein
MDSTDAAAAADSLDTIDTLQSSSLRTPSPAASARPPVTDIDRQRILWQQWQQKDKEEAEARARERSNTETGIKALQGEQATLEQSAQTHRDEAQDLIKAQDELAKMKNNQPKNVMKQSPLFLGMMALAGGLTKQSGATMLGAMNGMVQGLSQGNQKQFEDANAQYEQQFQMLKDKVNLIKDTYSEYLDAYGNTLQGQEAAWRIANANAGLDEKSAIASAKSKEDIFKLWETMDKNEEERQHQLAQAEYWRGIVDARRKAAAGGGAGGKSTLLDTKRIAELRRLPLKDMDARLKSLRDEQVSIKRKYDQFSPLSKEDNAKMVELEGEIDALTKEREERAKALGEIPDTDYADIVRALKAQGKSSPSEDDIVSTWRMANENAG